MENTDQLKNVIGVGIKISEYLIVVMMVTEPAMNFVKNDCKAVNVSFLTSAQRHSFGEPDDDDIDDDEDNDYLHRIII